MTKYQVSVYHTGSIYPSVVNPCRTKDEAEQLAKRIKERCERNGWNHDVVIEEQA